MVLLPLSYLVLFVVVVDWEISILNGFETDRWNKTLYEPSFFPPQLPASSQARAGWRPRLRCPGRGLYLGPLGAGEGRGAGGAEAGVACWRPGVLCKIQVHHYVKTMTMSLFIEIQSWSKLSSICFKTRRGKEYRMGFTCGAHNTFLYSDDIIF